MDTLMCYFLLLRGYRQGIPLSACSILQWILCSFKSGIMIRKMIWKLPIALSRSRLILKITISLHVMSDHFSRYSEKSTASYTVNALIMHCTWCPIISVGILRKSQLPTLSMHSSCIALMSLHFSRYSEKSTASCTVNTLTMHCTSCSITLVSILRKAQLPTLSIHWPCIALDVSLLQ